MRVRWVRDAVQALASIRDYIAEQNPETANRFVDSLFTSVTEQLKSFPHSGRKIPELNRPKYREIIFKDYRIMYKILDDEVVILTVRNGRQLFNETTLDD